MELNWIDCKDRLPEEGQFFIAFGPGLGNHVRGPTMDFCLFDGELWVEHGTERADGREQWFTHWMPIPKPPGV